MDCDQIAKCQETVIKQVEAICTERGLRLTPLRKRVLEMIWQTHTAAKAYDLLALLRRENHSAKPPTIYRALEFLEKHHFIHKLYTVNGYIGCHTPRHHHACLFLICTKCHRIAEQHNAQHTTLLDTIAHDAHFTLHDAMLEVKGICEACR